MRLPLFLLAAMLCSMAQAEVVRVKCNEAPMKEGESCYWLNGDIDAAAADQIEAISPLNYIYLSSDGGDVRSAFRIGRHLRKELTYAIVQDKCLSACVFVLAGAAVRDVRGPVGIHRPYNLDTKEISYAEAQARYTALQDEAKAYLREMNITDYLYDLMVTIPPSKMKIVTKPEIDSFMLDQADPVFNEMNIQKNSQKYGLSIPEYLSKIQYGISQCLNETTDTINNACLEKIMKK